MGCVRLNLMVFIHNERAINLNRAVPSQLADSRRLHAKLSRCWSMSCWQRLFAAPVGLRAHARFCHMRTRELYVRLQVWARELHVCLHLPVPIGRAVGLEIDGEPRIGERLVVTP